MTQQQDQLSSPSPGGAPAPPSSTAAPTTWMGYKDLARRQYERGDYEGALVSYQSALKPDMNCTSNSERQILLSNLVACRLKIGGRAQAQAAIQEAKDCIAINPQWSKGHVRLASAYIGMGSREYSNDACNELQRALAIDPGNSTAREMLIRELRRDHANASTSRANNGASGSAASSSSASTTTRQPQSSQDESNSSRRRQDSSSSSTSPQAQHHRDDGDDGVDDSLSWSEWIQFHIDRMTDWYENQSDDMKTIWKILIGLLVLYVAFGGRFGLEAPRPKGNYGNDNVYNQYRRYGTTTTSSSSSYPYRYQDNSNNNNHRYTNNHRRQQQQHHQRRGGYDDYNDEYYYDNGNNYYNNGGGGGGWSSMMDSGSVPGMLMLGGIMFAGHRLGINPFQTMMFMNMMGGRGRRRGFVRPGGGFGMGFGGGFGGGMGRRGYAGGGLGRRRF